MPHISIEYSANLEQAIAPARLVEVVHRAALDAGVFATSRVRTFAQPVADFRVAGGEAGEGFVRITARIAPGRDLPTRQAIAEGLFEAASRHLDAAFRTHRLGCQLEVQELDAALTLRRSNLETP